MRDISLLGREMDPEGTGNLDTNTISSPLLNDVQPNVDNTEIDSHTEELSQIQELEKFVNNIYPKRDSSEDSVEDGVEISEEEKTTLFFCSGLSTYQFGGRRKKREY